METNKEGKKLNIGVSSGVIGFIMLASFLYKKLNQPTKQDVKNQINVPSVNPSYGFDSKPPAYNNFGSGNLSNTYKVDVHYPEININEYLESKAIKPKELKSNTAMDPLPNISVKGRVE